VRFDHVIDLRDDDGRVRPAYLLGEQDGRIHVIVSRGVGQTHALSRPADRVVDYNPGPVHKAGEPGCPWHGEPSPLL
jgi:hypothetical protein